MSNEGTATSAAAQSGRENKVEAFTGHPGLPMEKRIAKSDMNPMPLNSKQRIPLVEGAMSIALTPNR